MAKETFTDTDQQRLDELLAKRDRVRRQEQEERQAEEAAAFQAVEPIFQHIDWDNLKPALETAMEADNLAPDTRQRLSRLHQILSFDFERGLMAERERLRPPEEPTAPEEPTPAE